jgi:hypothetical protein
VLSIVVVALSIVRYVMMVDYDDDGDDDDNFSQSNHRDTVAL